jgi:hypothetical protein
MSEKVRSLPEGKSLKALPRWAQEHIQILQMRLDEAQTKIAELVTNDPTDTLAHDYVYGSQYLRTGQAIRFLPDPLSDFPYIEVQIKDDGDGRTLWISGSHELTVRPWVTNVIRVTTEPTR